MKPLYDYCLGEYVNESNGLITTRSLQDTKQKYRIISVGGGRVIDGVLQKPPVKVGDVVIIQKHAAEGDTPHEMYQKNLALFQATRIMAIMEGEK